MFCGENGLAFYNVTMAQEGSKEWLEVLTCEQAGSALLFFGGGGGGGRFLLICFGIQFCILIRNTASKHRGLHGKKSCAR